MDKIQRTLIKAGHKDLAQKYFEKIATVKTIKNRDKSLHCNTCQDGTVATLEVKETYPGGFVSVGACNEHVNEAKDFIKRKIKNSF